MKLNKLKQVKDQIEDFIKCPITITNNKFMFYRATVHSFNENIYIIK